MFCCWQVCITQAGREKSPGIRFTNISLNAEKGVCNNIMKWVIPGAVDCVMSLARISVLLNGTVCNTSRHAPLACFSRSRTVAAPSIYRGTDGALAPGAVLINSTALGSRDRRISAVLSF